MPTELIQWVENGLLLAGLLQMLLFVMSFIIPRCLEWGKPLMHLPLLMRQVFWTYAGYILMMHLFFGVLSFFGSQLLLDGTPQAAILCGLMGMWWFTRIILQFFCFDRKGIPQTRFNILAEGLLIAMFLFLTVVYITAVYINLS